ncbi:MAG TPA: hypothetical protein DEG69_09740, partial [Flavobacteriaceae bacterium]|nr:hypothetical protein [Flavobacteriaceae bacterium]
MKYSRFCCVFILLLFSVCFLQAQSDTSSQIKVEVKLENPSKEINNGIATIKVEGGSAPYKYKWSNQATS